MTDEVVIVIERGDVLTIIEQVGQVVQVALGEMGAQGPPGGGGGGGIAGDTPVFIQPVAPVTTATAYSWWDTSGGNLTLYIEDGI